MSIGTYAQLQTAIEEWLEGDDIDARTTDLIALAEAEINRTISVLDMIASVNATIAANTTALPADFVEIVSLRAGGSTIVELDFIPPAQYYSLGYYNTGRPTAYSMVGTNILWGPQPDSFSTYTYYLDYKARVPALSDTATTNWLLTKHPDLYLYASLMQAAPYLENDERTPVWENTVNKIRGQMHAADNRARRRPRGRMRSDAGVPYEGLHY